MNSSPNTTNETTFGRIGRDDALKAVKAENTRAGVIMSGADEIATAHHLANALRHDPTTGRTFVIDAAGNEKVGVSAASFISMLQASATPASPDKAEVTPLSATARAIQKNKTDRLRRTAGR